MDNTLPKDPVILLSYVNTNLRDYDKNFFEFCKRKGVKGQEILEKLEQIDYTYDEKLNQFV
ncbi:MAG TPA: DUF4250 domain-containing protein [Lachnospiraceae bacterium]